MGDIYNVVMIANSACLRFILNQKVLHFIMILSYIYTNTYNTECKQAETLRDTNITGKHIPFVSVFLFDT